MVRTLSITPLVFAVTATLVIVPAFSQTPVNTTVDNIAIRGYNPVAYFQEGAARQGSASFEYVWNDVTWHFASPENLERFQGDPERYAPQFGGYCAWAASQGYVADIDPDAWTVHEGRLYLNFSSGIRRRFMRDIEDNIEAAERNWPTLAADIKPR